MCWPSSYLKGGVEIQERYPITDDPREPRHKRLHFVREPSSPRRSSDEWALVHSSFNANRPRRNLEMRDNIRMINDRQNRIMWENAQQRQLLQQALQNQQPRPVPIGWDPHHGGGGHPHHGGGGHPQMRMLPHQGHDDEVVEEWQGPPPRVIEAKPRSPMPGYVRADRHGHGHGRGRSRSRHRRDYSRGSVYSDDSYRGQYSDDSFEGLHSRHRRRW
ncbi:MAG: hypothetical protein Q9167_006628 [Letrouitia subvulpina]